MAIKDLQPRQGFDLIEGEITAKGEVREFQKFGKPGRVCTAVLKDGSSQCNFSLWNEQIDEVNVGDRIRITDGYANEWQGEIQVSTGRNGKIEILGKSDPAEKPAEAKADEATEEETIEESEQEDTVSEEPEPEGSDEEDLSEDEVVEEDIDDEKA